MAAGDEEPRLGARVSVDFPRPGEVIEDGYAVRVSAPPDATRVEVNIDRRGWLACRPAAGHWWRDWSGRDDGEHEIAARAVVADGRTIGCEPREFLSCRARRSGR